MSYNHHLQTEMRDTTSKEGRNCIRRRQGGRKSMVASCEPIIVAYNTLLSIDRIY
jgi:hypothetical protein